MEQQRIRLCIVWHQHQPNYRVGDQMVMPWSWLHATKDYLEMAQHLSRHPKVHATVNLVPSLVRQLEDYVEGRVHDPVVTLLEKPVSDWTSRDKDEVLRTFFMVNPKIIATSPRYLELKDWSDQRKVFGEDDFRDLAVHFALAWTGALSLEIEPWKSLVLKDRCYKEAERRSLMSAQRRLVAEVIPAYQALASTGQVELSTSPFYHPIVPLLIDTDVAKEAEGDTQLPQFPFQFSGDARHQIRSGLEYMHSTFGHKPVGMWPSEGSISDAALTLFREEGIDWVASDEAVLRRTLAERIAPEMNRVTPELAKYFPWHFQKGDGPVIFFRDHGLSDKIGFTYQSWSAQDAANDFIRTIEAIRDRILAVDSNLLGSACVTVILDGENCWEYYPNNGNEFLEALYAALENSAIIQTCKCGDVSRTADQSLTLPHVPAGSWIDANFRIWIGHPEDNAAWDALRRAREWLAQQEATLANLPPNSRSQITTKLEEAREHLMIAEGSDWFWWYGDDHVTQQGDLFDGIFRAHLRASYAVCAEAVPEDLLLPIRGRAGLRDFYNRVNTNVGDSAASENHADAVNWQQYPNLAPRATFGPMHKSSNWRLDELRVASLGDWIRLRISLSPKLGVDESMKLHVANLPGTFIHITMDGATWNAPGRTQTVLQPGAGETYQISIPASYLRGKLSIDLVCEVNGANGISMRIPQDGTITCALGNPS